MQTKKYLFILFSLILVYVAHGQKYYSITSLNGNIRLAISISDSIRWSLSNKSEVLISKGVSGLQITGKPFVGYNEKIKKITRKSNEASIYAIVPVMEQNIKDQYNELTINFKSGNELIFRAYNNGVAYRWITHFKDSINIENEVLSYSFPENEEVFWGSDKENKFFQSHYELIFKDTSLSAYTKSQFCALPLYINTKKGTKLLLSESDLLDYSNLFFFGTGGNAIIGGFPKVIAKEKLVGDRGTGILENRNYIARTKGSRTFPWRVIMVAELDKDLLQNNLVYQLASPNILTDTSWIKPGKVAWDWWNDNNIYGVDFKSGINNQTYKYYIDFASKFGLEYILLDEGWTQSTWTLTVPKADIDLPELVAYGKKKGVGVWLWTLWNPMDKDMEKILSTYEKWGVKGVKVDFMARADQYMVNFYERLAQNAAKHHLMVDLHGAYKPVGLNRKYPNILSYEGVKGLENYKWTDEEANPPHDVTIPFTRMVLGAMDYTPGAMRNSSKQDFHANYSNPMSEGTRAHQVAMYAVYESPLQMLADNPSNYLKDSVTTMFIAHFPTIWDRTIALDGKIGQYVALARKNGKQWYIGALTNWDARTLKIKLDFLTPGKKYNLTYFSDGINAAKFPEDYKIGYEKVYAGQAYSITMQPGGGWAAMIMED